MESLKNIKSPITNGKATIVETLSVDKIIESYKTELNIDVSDYFKDTPNLYILECIDTSYRFYYPPIIGKATLYHNLNSFEWYYQKWKWENEECLINIQKEDNILDVGCGNGDFLIGLKQRGYSKLTGIDSSIIQNNNFENNSISFFCSNIENFAKTNAKRFDVITCFQILEHISDINEFIISCKKMLNKDGRLIVSVPNNNKYIYKHDVYHNLNLPPHHQGLWNTKSLIQLGAFFKFEIKEIKIQPIGNYIGKYTLVQLKWLKNKNLVLRILFSNKFSVLIFSKILYTFRNKLNGRDVLVVYSV